MPTDVGDLTGRPSPARVTVSAVRITLSNANSLSYLNLYRPQELKFRPGRDGLKGPVVGRAYSCKRFRRAKVTGFFEETQNRWNEGKVTGFFEETQV
jgi:hypothetical protein